MANKSGDINLTEFNKEKTAVLIETARKRDNHEVNLQLNDGIHTGWCMIYKGWCKNKDTGEISHVAMKMGLMNGSTSRFEKCFANEILFYSAISTKWNMFQKQKNVSTALISLENIAPAGYRPFDTMQTLNAKHLQMIFETYGKFHALSFTYKQEHPDLFNQTIKDLIDIRVARPKKNDLICMEGAYLAIIRQLDSDIAHTFKNLDFKATVANARKYYGNYSCLTHVDFRLRNVMFKYDKTSNAPENIKLINFQLLCLGTPVHDLSTIFYKQAEKFDMDKLDWYLWIYYNSFSEFTKELGGDPQQMYPFAVLKEEWKIYSAAAIAIGVALWAQRSLIKSELSLIRNRKDLTKEECFKFLQEKLLETEHGRIFRDRAKNICKHAVQYGIF